jgi:hypothetical protein
VHFAATHDGTTGRLYINGTLAAATNAISYILTPVNSQGSESTIGAMRRGFGPAGRRFWQGLLDEIGVYNRALDASEILAIFNAGSAGKCKGEVAALGPGTFWIGLKNSDDQGTQFDLQAQVLINSTVWQRRRRAVSPG